MKKYMFENPFRHLSILVFCLLSTSQFLSTPAYAEDWWVGKIVGLCRGTHIYRGSSESYGYHTIVPENDWAVKITGGPRGDWWDTSRKAAGDPSGGTGWVKKSESESCKQSAPPPPPPPPPPPQQPSQNCSVQSPPPEFGKIIGLSRGTRIYNGPVSDQNTNYHTTVPENNWAVKITSGPRYLNDNQGNEWEWWDTSRRDACDPSGGTGWIPWRISKNAPPKSNPQVSLGVSPSSVLANQSVSVSWNNFETTGNDWISLHLANTPDSSYRSWQRVSGSSGSLTFTVPSESGLFDFRLFRNGGKVATSNTFQVSDVPSSAQSSSAPAQSSNSQPVQSSPQQQPQTSSQQTSSVPQASISFSADRIDLTGGDCSNLKWDVENARAVYLDNQGAEGHETRRVCPSSTTTYTLRVVTNSGDVIRQVTINVSQSNSVQPPSCNPNANEIALFIDSDFRGQCIVKSIGNYSNSAAIGLPNDSISSIKIGSAVKAVLCGDDNYGGTCETFASDDSNLTGESIGNDRVSSVQISSRSSSGTTNVQNANPAPVSPSQKDTNTSAVSNLRIGNCAQVTDANKLNVRTGPGTGFAKQVAIDEGTIVKLTEGPVFQDGYTWWKHDHGGWSAGDYLKDVSCSGNSTQPASSPQLPIDLAPSQESLPSAQLKPIPAISDRCWRSSSTTVTCKAVGVKSDRNDPRYAQDPFIGIFELPGEDLTSRHVKVKFRANLFPDFEGAGHCGSISGKFTDAKGVSHELHPGFQFVQGCVHGIELSRIFLGLGADDPDLWEITYDK